MFVTIVSAVITFFIFKWLYRKFAANYDGDSFLD